MSTRSLKEVLKEQEQQHQHHSDGEEEEEAESPNLTTRPAINPFDLLNDDDFDQENESEITLENSNNDKKEPSVMKSMAGVVSKSNQKSKKKKKKSKAGPSSTSEKLLDEELETLSLDFNSSRHQPDPIKNRQEDEKLREEVVKQSAPSILQVDPRCLNPENELRRIFGSKVVKSFERSNQASSARQIRHPRRGSIISERPFLSLHQNIGHAGMDLYP